MAFQAPRTSADSVFLHESRDAQAFGSVRSVRPMSRTPLLGALVGVALVAACSGGDGGGGEPGQMVPPPVEAGGPDAPVVGPDGSSDAGRDAPDAADPCASPSAVGADCADTWEKRAVARFDAAMKVPADRTAFLVAMPKGGDLHNHLTGAVYAETYLAWSAFENGCINTSTYTAVFASQCSASTAPTPLPGTLFFDETVRAWSMKDFVAGAETGRAHFFATFSKYGAIAGTHRDDDIADVLKRAASENQLYVETMFNLGKNIADLAAPLFSGTMTPADLPAFYDAIVGDPNFATALAKDVAVVDSAAQGYKTKLGCGAAGAPKACDVGVRFVAQVARTGNNDEIFGQLVSAFEMASKTPHIVAANLSSPEDDTRSLNNYALQMAMLDFLHDKYAGTSPLHVTLHAGELVPKYLPAGHETDNTFHIRQAVETGHAERIGHGVDILSETDAALLMDEMKAKNVLVEICLASNDQILEVNGASHPLAEYLKKGVPVALATDDQGVSRSSMAGEYARAAIDQKLGYRQLKAMARNSLEHAFLPGASLWTSAADATPVAACAHTATMGLGDPPNATCKALLDASQRAAMQWELEKRFLAFERAQ